MADHTETLAGSPAAAPADEARERFRRLVRVLDGNDDNWPDELVPLRRFLEWEAATHPPTAHLQPTLADLRALADVLDAQATECTALRAAYKAASGEVERVTYERGVDRAALAAANESLWRYGRHDRGCQVERHACTCGFNAALHAARRAGAQSTSAAGAAPSHDTGADPRPEDANNG